MANCVGCGYCCKKAPCFIAACVHKTLEPWIQEKGCPSLRVENGRHICGIYADATGETKERIKEDLAIGAGCCSALNSERKKYL